MAQQPPGMTVDRLPTVESVQTALPGGATPAAPGLARAPGLRRADSQPFGASARVRSHSVESARTLGDAATGEEWTVLGGPPEYGPVMVPRPISARPPHMMHAQTMPPQAPEPMMVPTAMPPPSVPIVQPPRVDSKRVEPIFLGDGQGGQAVPESRTPQYNIATPPAGSQLSWDATVAAAATERDALIATAQTSRKQAQELAGKINWRVLFSRMTATSMAVTAVVLLVSAPHRGHDLARLPIRPGLDAGRPGVDAGCHNLWVWLASLFLLDLVHFLLHALEDSVATGPGDAWFGSAIHYGDYALLSARILASWFGVYLVLKVGGFFIAALLIVLVTVLILASMQLVGAAAGQEHNMGVGLIATLVVAAIVIITIVDHATKSACNGLLHTWAMLLTAVYTITLCATLVYLIVVGRDEWARRKPQVQAAMHDAMDKFDAMKQEARRLEQKLEASFA